MEQISQVSPTLHKAFVELNELSSDEEAQEAARICLSLTLLFLGLSLLLAFLSGSKSFVDLHRHYLSII